MSRSSGEIVRAIAEANRLVGSARTSGGDQWPSLEACGRAGAFYFLREEDWIARHVESLEVVSDRYARRRVTIDLDLPGDPAAAVGKEEDGTLFCVPLTYLAKSPPSSYFDVRDQDGAVVPLMTRQENAEISYTALRAALLGVADEVPYPQFEADIADVVYGTGLDATLGLAVLVEETGMEEPLESVAAALAGSSCLWTFLRGAPGERRIVKLSYDVQPGRPPWVIRKRTEREVIVEDDTGREWSTPLLLPGPIDVPATLARWAAPAVTALGWAAIDVDLDPPIHHGFHSYHMQVTAPDGLQIWDVRSDSVFEDQFGDELRLEAVSEDTTAHLYASAARLEQPAPIRLSFRAQRRGFLNLSLATALFTALGLWFAQAHAEFADNAQNTQTAAAVLLVLPALLALFAVRPAEHALVSRLLFGVRALVFVSGLVAVLAAAALAGVRPSAWEDVSEAWIWYAALASGVGLMVVVAWAAALRPVGTTVRWWAGGHEGLSTAARLARVVLLGLAIAALALTIRADDFDSIPWRIAGTLALFALAVGGIRLVAPPMSEPAPTGFGVVALLLPLAATGAALSMWLVDQGAPRDGAELVAAAVAVVSIVLALCWPYGIGRGPPITAIACRAPGVGPRRTARSPALIARLT